MLEPGLAADESRRLRALRSLGLLGISNHPRFEPITRTAALALSVPTVAITLIDAKEQWLLSSQGQLTQSVPRSLTFCGHAVATGEALVVLDATQDPRFANNPLVTGPQGIRFYAGEPLMSLENHALGALCVIDQKRRSFDERSAQILHGLASWAQTELNAIERERLHLDAVRKRLLAPAVHQLLGSLSSVHGFSEFLLSNEVDASQRHELLQTIHSQSEHLRSLISELVQMFQIESIAGHDLRLAWQSLTPMLLEAVEACRAADTGLRIKLDIDERLPNAMVDASLIQQAILQLLSNCLRHSSKQPEVRVSLKQADSSKYLAVTVHDSDPTLRAETHLGRMFEPFYRANRYDLGSGNAAYGLATVKHIAELHGGSVEDVSTQGKGLAIRLIVPVSRPQ
jgi:two-component system, sensor histidine kinase